MKRLTRELRTGVADVAHNARLIRCLFRIFTRTHWNDQFARDHFLSGISRPAFLLALFLRLIRCGIHRFLFAHLLLFYRIFRGWRNRCLDRTLPPASTFQCQQRIGRASCSLTKIIQGYFQKSNIIAWWYLVLQHNFTRLNGYWFFKWKSG